MPSRAMTTHAILLYALLALYAAAWTLAVAAPAPTAASAPAATGSSTETQRTHLAQRFTLQALPAAQARTGEEDRGTPHHPRFRPKARADIQSYSVIAVHDIKHQYGYELQEASSGPARQSPHPENSAFSLTLPVHAGQQEQQNIGSTGSEPLLQTYNVRLAKNRHLFAPGYHEIRQRYHPSTHELLSETKVDVDVEQINCYYKGHVDVSSSSSSESTNTKDGKIFGTARIHTCGTGFSGVLQFPQGEHHEPWVAIEPAVTLLTQSEIALHVQQLGLQAHQAELVHVIYTERDISQQRKIQGACGYGKHSGEGDDRSSSHPNLQEQRSTTTESKAAGRMEPHTHFVHAPAKQQQVFRPQAFQPSFPDANKVVPRTLNAPLRYVELLIVNDFERFQQFSGGHRPVEEDAAAMVSLVDQVYNTLQDYGGATADPNIIIVAQVTFVDGDPYPMTKGSCTPLADGTTCTSEEVDVAQLLNRFHFWRSSNASVPSHDNGQLFSGFDFIGGVLGYAGVGSMCFPSSSGGIDMTRSTNYLDSRVIAHEMGHNFGMHHDSSHPDTAACPSSGFIMNSHLGSPPSAFSSCSVYEFDQNIGSQSCLTATPPSHQWGDPVCGNGFVEAGEVCDCGHPTNCLDASSVDRCCTTSCTLRVGAVCSESQGCCDGDTCSLQSAGFECRAQDSTVCDVSETCTGTDAECPLDLVYGAGTECDTGSFGTGQCFNGECLNHDYQCDDVSFRVTGTDHYTSCPSSDQSAFNNGQFCNVMYCTPPGGGTCSAFRQGGQKVTMWNGVPCASGKQCKDAQCVSSQDLNENFDWVEGGWSGCTSCDETQTQTVTCKLVNRATGETTTYDDIFCTPSSKPATERACLDPSLNCDRRNARNSVISKGRDIVERFGFLDKSDDLRSLVPRSRFYSQDFDPYDSDYWKGIGLMGIPGAVWFFAAIVTWCLFKRKRDRLLDHERGDSDPCCDPRPQFDGYTNSQKCCTTVGLLIFGGALYFVFFAMGEFFNVELSSGTRDANVGLVVATRTIADDALALTTELQLPVRKLNTTANNQKVSLQPTLQQIHQSVLDQNGLFDITFPIRGAETVLNDNRWNITIPGVGVAADVIFNCTFCERQFGTAFDARAEVGDNAQGVVSVIFYESDRADNYLLNATIEADEIVSVSDQRMLSAREQIIPARNDLIAFHDDVQKYDPWRLAITAVLFLVVGVTFIIVILSLFIKKDGCFEHIYGLAMYSWAFMGILFAFHLPFAVATGDSCDWLAKVELDLTIWFDADNAILLDQCLTKSSMLDVMNYTRLVDVTQTFNFSPVGDVASAFNFPILTQLETDVNAATIEDSFEHQFGTPQSFMGRLDAELVVLNGLTGGSFTRANVRTCCPGAVGATRQSRDTCFTLLNAEEYAQQVLDDVNFNVTKASQYAVWRKDNYTNLDSQLRATEPDIQLINIDAQDLKRQAHCDEIGTWYGVSKKAYCDTIVVSFAFLALSMFVIGLSSVFVFYFGAVSLKRIPSHERVAGSADKGAYGGPKGVQMYQ